MKSLRSKLFLSVGVILLLVALLSYFLPNFLVRRDIKKASTFIQKRFLQTKSKLQRIASFLVSYHILESAAELEAASGILNDLKWDKNDRSPWIFAAHLASYNPDIAFVQITEKGNYYSVIPQDAQLYTPLGAPFEQDMLWIRVPEKDGYFVALADKSEGEGFYLLFHVEDLNALILEKKIRSTLKEKLEFANEIKGKKEISFTPFETKPSLSSTPDSMNQLYQVFLAQETMWAIKMELIQKLAPWQDQVVMPVGMLKINTSSSAFCLFSESIFSSVPILKNDLGKDHGYLVRDSQNGKDIDLTRYIKTETRDISLGISLSEMVKKIAEVIKHPIMISLNGKNVVGYTEEGKEANADQAEFKGYVPYEIPLNSHISITILSDKKQEAELQSFLKKLQSGLIAKISSNLIAASLISLALALFLLGRISKKITKPISLLAIASQEIGKGKYDGLILPDSEKRKDEVAVLAHSFENMVVSLKDREKIRGVLNKVVSKEIAEEILNSHIDLGGEERVITMLFSDIRGFTRLSEHLSPRELIGMLNDYMTEMCRIIDATKGVVDKFVGDEIMALYGAPLFFQDHARKAVEAARLMIDTLQNWNKIQQINHKPIFEIGIGIHSGLVFSGNMGAENRLNYTVVGSNVNLASRICSIAKPMQILISEDTWKTLGQESSKISVKKLEPVSLKGIEHPVSLYEVL